MQVARICFSSAYVDKCARARERVEEDLGEWKVCVFEALQMRSIYTYGTMRTLLAVCPTSRLASVYIRGKVYWEGRRGVKEAEGKMRTRDDAFQAYRSFRIRMWVCACVCKQKEVSQLSLWLRISLSLSYVGRELLIFSRRNCVFATFALCAQCSVVCFFTLCVAGANVRRFPPTTI